MNVREDIPSRSEDSDDVPAGMILPFPIPSCEQRSHHDDSADDTPTILSFVDESADAAEWKSMSTEERFALLMHQKRTSRRDIPIPHPSPYSTMSDEELILPFPAERIEMTQDAVAILDDGTECVTLSFVEAQAVRLELKKVLGSSQKGPLQHAMNHYHSQASLTNGRLLALPSNDDIYNVVNTLTFQDGETTSVECMISTVLDVFAMLKTNSSLLAWEELKIKYDIIDVLLHRGIIDFECSEELYSCFGISVEEDQVS